MIVYDDRIIRHFLDRHAVTRRIPVQRTLTSLTDVLLNLD